MAVFDAVINAQGVLAAEIQRLTQFQQWTFIQRDQATARRIDISNQRDDNGDENWKDESLKN